MKTAINQLNGNYHVREGDLMSCYYIIGVRLENRIGNAVKFQEVLTKNGCRIKTRLGLHEVSDDACSNDGIVILQPYGSKEDVEALVNELNSLDGVTARYIDLN